MVLLPLLLNLAFVVAADRDWAQCAGYEIPHSFLEDFSQDLVATFLDIRLFLVQSVGFLAAALVWCWLKSRVIIALWLLMVVTTLLLIGDPSGWHDCDRKGSYVIFGVVLVQAVGFALTIVSLGMILTYRP